MSGARELRKANNYFRDLKQDVIQRIPGELGVQKDGVKQVEVPGRPGYVWARLRSDLSELVQVFNDQVSPVYGLAVLVERDKVDKGRYRVIGRDLGRYQSWGSSPYLPKHGAQHSFNPVKMGGDVVWVWNKQIMPLLAYPSGSSGGPNVVIGEGVIFNDNTNTWVYAGATGTADLLPNYKPTGSANARMTLVYIDDNTNPKLLIGDEFSASLTGTAAILPYIPSPPSDCLYALAGIRLLTGTSYISWDNIYDVRNWASVPSTTAAPAWVRTVTVDINGNGDYLTVEDACDYVDTQSRSDSERWIIYVYPGTYNENPFSVPSFTTVVGAYVNNLSFSFGAVHIVFDDTEGTLINMYEESALVSLYISCEFAVTNDWKLMYMNEAGTMYVTNCSIYIHQETPGSLSNIGMFLLFMDVTDSIAWISNSNLYFRTESTGASGGEDDLPATFRLKDNSQLNLFQCLVTSQNLYDHFIGGLLGGGTSVINVYSGYYSGYGLNYSVGSAVNFFGNAYEAVDLTTTLHGGQNAIHIRDKFIINDTPTDNQILKFNEGLDQWEFSDPGAQTFLELSDTPASYTGSANYTVRVNAGESGLEFAPSLGNVAIYEKWDTKAPPITGSAYDDEFLDSTLSGWTVFNPDSLLSVSENNYGLQLTQQNSSRISLCGVYKEAPATPWSIETYVSFSALSADLSFAGIMLWENASGTANKMALFGLRYNAANSVAIILNRYANYSGTVTTVGTAHTAAIISSGYFLRVRMLNATDIAAEYSTDGVGWKRYYSGALGGTWAGAPVNVGVGLNNQTSGDNIVGTFQFFRVTESDVGLYSVINGRKVPIGGNALHVPVAIKSTDYTLTDTDGTILVSGNTTITLPTAVGRGGRMFVIKKTDLGTVLTVDADGSETIDGALTQVISAQYDSITVVSDGSNWMII